MLILAIDTSTMCSAVSLCDGRRIIAEERLQVEATHSEQLLLTIEHLLNVSGIEKSRIAAVAVAVGPGSFTGLRIGLSTAKGIAVGLDVPIVGVSSLLALAYNGVFHNGSVVPVIDAKRGEIYFAAYRFNGTKPKIIVKESVCPPSLLALKLKNLKGQRPEGHRPNDKILFVGDAVHKYDGVLKQIPGALVPDFDVSFPSAACLAFAAHDRLKKNKQDDIAGLAPNYIRNSDAEIGFNKKHKK